MMKKFLYKLTSNLPCRLIQRDDQRYLERYYLGACFGKRFYLHRFVSGDGDLEVHNHPWDAFSICLAGGYKEEFVTGICIKDGWHVKYRKMFPGKINRIKANDFHRIDKVIPNTWTLFVHNDKVKQKWGFLRHETGDHFPNGGQVVFHQPYEMMNGRQWWKEVPLGKDSNRLPINQSV